MIGSNSLKHYKFPSKKINRNFRNFQKLIFSENDPTYICDCFYVGKVPEIKEL